MKIKVNNIEIRLTDAQVATIAEEYNSKPQKVELQQFKLEGGEWAINNFGYILNSNFKSDARNFGMEFKTKKSAEQVSKEMRISNRLRALAHQIHPNYKVPSIGEHAYFIFKNHNGFQINSHINIRVPGIPYMAEPTAIVIQNLLHNGLFYLGERNIY